MRPARHLPLLTLTLVLCACSAANHGGLAGSKPGGYYLALGDSLAAGYQDSTTVGDRACAHRRPDTVGEHGYVCDLFWRLKAKTPRIRVKDLGIATTPGEDSCSFRTLKGCPGTTSRRNLLPFDVPPYPIRREPQLQAAVRFLDQQKRRIRLITLDLGGNDFAPALEAAVAGRLGRARHRAESAFLAFKSNYADIVARLREAAPKAVIALIDQYDPLSGLPLFQANQNRIDRITSKMLHRVRFSVRRIARADSCLFVDVAPAFKGRATSLTHILSDNVHPTSRGYETYAVALWRTVKPHL